MKFLAGHPPPVAARLSAWRLFPVIWCGLILGTIRGIAAAPLIIDDFAYATTTAARQAWVATSAPAVAMAASGEWGTGQVMTLTCDFAVRNDRCIWDRTVNLNLTGYTDFALEVFAPDPGAISSFTLYFKSGSGWYGASASFTGPGWQTLRFSRKDFIPEGTPTGWHAVQGIRLSPWKAAARNTYLAARELRAFTPPVLLLKDGVSSNPTVVQETIDRHLEWLGGFNIECGVVSRADVEAGLLAQARMVILPYNENLSSGEWTALENFVAAGGKLLVYYLLPTRMEPLLGMRATGWAQGDYAAWVFADPSISGLPARVRQASWNITFAVPNGMLHSRVSATWESSSGASIGRAAWLTSDNGCFVSHILLADDADAKAFALLCFIGHFLPEVWPAAAAGAIDGIGRIGPFQTYGEAAGAIRQQAAGRLRAPLVETELATAESERSRATNALASADYPQAIQAANSAQAALRQAYALSLRSRAPEFRAFWEHHATGPYPGNWAAAINVLATNGFTDVFPNLLWGGVADYNSAFLPHSSAYDTYGDQVAACVSAAHARGIRVHVWKVNYNLSGAPQAFIDSLRAANRTQVSSSGQAIDWLCPSHPDNFTLETNSMLEVVRNYAVDGIHFDYIRYPDANACYCSGCGTRFQSQTGQTVTSWPAGVLASGPLRTAFLDWRRAQVTRLVAAVYAGVKAIKPGVQVSAAVWPDAPSALDGVGQDWRKWIADGIVDFLCPMDYTTRLDTFTNYVAQQLGYAAGRIPIYPGIGAFILEPDGVLAQLEAMRAAGAGGFILFELNTTVATSLLPIVRAGATAPDLPDADNDLLPDSWETNWFGNLTVAGRNTDTDRDGLSDWSEWVLGSDPGKPNPGLSLQMRAADNNLEVFFTGTAAEGPGYENAERRYRLETAGALAGGPAWVAAPGVPDRVVASGTRTVSFPISAGEPGRFYRVRVWLQQKPL